MRTSLQPLGVPGTWIITLSEEFEEPALNSKVWATGWFGDGVLTDPVSTEETDCYYNKQLRLTQGCAAFTARANTEGLSCKAREPNLSAMISSNGRFQQSYGYFEARLQQPAGDGVWPAFWLNGQTWPDDMEVDVIEGDGSDSGAYNVHYACSTGECNLNSTNRVVSVPTATSSMHVYGADVEPMFVKFYYDGALVGTYSGAVPSAARYILVGLGTSGGALEVPKTLTVDYIRAWSQ